MSRFALLLVLCLLARPSIATAEEALLRQLTDSVQAELKLTPAPHFILRGLELDNLEQARQLVTLSVESSALDKPPAIIGSYQLQADGLVFRPRFPLSRSVVYRLHVADKLLGQTVDERNLLFSLPTDPSLAAPTVAAVYPSADVLPENLLKFYLHFSQPMSRGEAYRRIHLFQGETEIKEPFLELGEELWNADQTRFTLFIHPGRIKRGVQPRELRGPSLTPGSHYTLRIDGEWRSAQGLPLETGFEKQFQTSAAQHGQLNPERWKIETPPVDSRQAVGLVFDLPLDHAMLQRVLSVRYNDGSLIDGQLEILEHESRWQFTPTEKWKVGAYNIEVATNLEDLCGNSIARPFEVDLQAQSTPVPAARIAIEFIVK